MTNEPTMAAPVVNPPAPAVSRPMRVVAVVSGKGGVGKTTVAVSLSLCAAQRGLRVLLIDADLGLANAQLMMGLHPRYHLGDVLSGAVSVQDALVHGPHGMCVLSAGSGIQHLSQLTMEDKQTLLAALDPVADQFDVVFVDNASGIGDNVLFFCAASQQVVVVASPEPTSLTDAYSSIKVLSEQGGVRHFGVLVNMVAGEARAREVFGRLTSVTRRFLKANVSYLGHVPRDGRVHAAVMAQKALVAMFPNTPTARALADVEVALISAPPPMPDGGLKLFLDRTLQESQPPNPAV